MFLRHICLGILTLCLTQSPLMAQYVDKDVQAAGQEVVVQLEKQAKPLIPKGAELMLRAEDGRVFSWHIGLSKSLDVKALAKEIGTDASDIAGTLDKWSAGLNAKLIKLTQDAVNAAGKDPNFNPNTDVTVSVGGHILPGEAPKELSEHDPTWYWISFTGLRRNPTYDNHGKVVAPAQGEPTGGEIKVTIAPDHQDWSLRQTITGRIAIKNTGKARVRLSAWWINDVKVTDEKGAEPQTFSIQGLIDPAPNAAMYRFLDAGEEYTGTFNVYADRLHSMQHGYYLGPGKWLLSYAPAQTENVRVVCEPVTIRVVVKDDQYTGPRALDVRGAGPNIVVQREGGILEAVDAEKAEILGIVRLEGYRPDWIWFRARATFSSDGRLVSYVKNRGEPITVTNLFGKAPARQSLRSPPQLEPGPGGFIARRFTPDDSDLICATNFKILVLGTASGALVSSASVSEQWPDVSPDALYAAAMNGSTLRMVGNRGEDKYSVSIFDLKHGGTKRDVTIRGHGESAELHMGAGGAYLNDEFASSVVYIPYTGGEPREFAADSPCDFIGESADGRFVAFAWPWSERGRHDEPTTVGVYRVADGKQFCTIKAQSPQSAALLVGPRIVCTQRHPVDSGHWLSEEAKLYDGLTGKFIKSISLTPRADQLPKQLEK